MIEHNVIALLKPGRYAVGIMRTGNISGLSRRQQTTRMRQVAQVCDKTEWRPDAVAVTQVELGGKWGLNHPVYDR